eukprot:1318648-Pyramimonas_sp.AAC.1
MEGRLRTRWRTCPIDPSTSSSVNGATACAWLCCCCVVSSTEVTPGRLCPPLSMVALALARREAPQAFAFSTSLALSLSLRWGVLILR